MTNIAFITEHAFVDRIIDRLKLRFVADKPPLSHVFEQVTLMAAEENTEHALPPPLIGVIDIAARPNLYCQYGQ